MLLKNGVRHNLHINYNLGKRLHRLHSEKAEPKTSAEVINFLESSPDYKDIKDVVPKHLLRKYKTPESMYLINKKTAKEIAATLKSFLKCNSPVIEVNPGFGFLSKELLQYVNHLYTYESSNSFSQFRNDLEKKYPGKMTCKSGDFFAMWKLAFQDKMDNGTRLTDFLGDLSTYDNDRIVKVVGAMPGISFVKHLLNTIIFHSGSSHLGRTDLYITMPVHHYEYLTDSQVSSTKHKSLPSLFQLLFDHEIISKIPKVHYLPWIHAPEMKKVSPISEHYLYVVKITQKAKLPCSSSHLPLLWYFFKPHMLSKTTRVIPMLEQWIPGCGVWLITGQDPPDTARQVAPDASDAPLPHMTIFTEFGDLDLRQKVTVFKRFISWPEFEQCPFRVTMENNLPKFISAIDMDDKDSITHIDDDPGSDTEH